MNNFVDSHFHIWDINDASSSHNGKTLGDPAQDFPSYSSQHYTDDIATSGKTFTGAIFVYSNPLLGILTPPEFSLPLHHCTQTPRWNVFPIMRSLK